MATIKPKTVDEYLANIESEVARNTLSHLRTVIREAAPEAEECISYGIPTYKFKGMVASFGAFKNHCSFFPGHTVRDFTSQLSGFKTLKGTIQFPHDKPLPDELVAQMIRARIAENAAP